MDKEEARLANLEKQKRFQRRHYKELRLAYWKYRALHPLQHIYPSGMFRVFALSDPRDEHQYPKYIGIGRFDNPCLWQPLMDVCWLSNAPWTNWLRRMGYLKLEPITHHILGGTVPLKWQTARDTARMVAEYYAFKGRIPKWARWPRWLLGQSAVPVGRRYPSGHIRRFSSVEHAVSRARGAESHRRILQYSHLAETDAHDCLWFED